MASSKPRRGPRELPPGTDLLSFLLTLPPEAREEMVRALGPTEADAFDADWPTWAHEGQRPPPGDWNTWVVKGGRGFGKTLTGAKWIEAAVARSPGPLRIALVGATLAEARAVMVEGRSGLLEVAGPSIRAWHPSLGMLKLRGGSVAQLFSGASPEQLRGPEHHIAWCDELAKWEKPQETWDMLQLGLRLGERPRVLVTTTPRPGPVLAGIMARPGCVTTGGATSDNPHLPRAFLDNVHALYAGTRLGRQELEGELLPDVPGALWTVELLEKCRHNPSPLWGSSERPALSGGQGCSLDGRLAEGERGEGQRSPAPFVTPPLPSAAAPLPPSPQRGEGSPASPPAQSTTLRRVIIAVDPPAGDGTCGIIACAKDAEGKGHVLADHSVTARSPEGWARAVAGAAAIHGTSEVVAESNQGGKMVAAVLRTADPGLKVRLVTATVGKAERAAPVAHLFEAGKVTLHGRFPELEAELLGMIAGGDYEGPGKSPDRADAMVWGITELLLQKEAAQPSIRRL